MSLSTIIMNTDFLMKVLQSILFDFFLGFWFVNITPIYVFTGLFNPFFIGF